MIPFNTADLTITIGVMQKISPSGYMILLDDSNKPRRVDILPKVYYNWTTSHKLPYFEKGKKVGILSYKGKIIDLEAGPTKGFDKEYYESWRPLMMEQIGALEAVVGNGEGWRTDGNFIYNFSKDAKMREKSFPFSHYEIRCINLTKLKLAAFIGTTGVIYTYRQIFTFDIDGQRIFSPTIGATDDLKKSFRDFESSFSLDAMNEHCYVNLDAILKLARIIGKNYGYEKNEYLQIPRLMLKYKTINIAQLPKPIKKTTPSPLSVYSLMAWLLGFVSKENDIYKLQQLQKGFVTLLSKGLVMKRHIDADIYTSGESIPLAKI